MQSAFKNKRKKQLKVEYASENNFRENLVLWILEKGAPIHYYLCSKRQAWNLDSDALIRFPEGSLGQLLGKFYKKEKFEPVPKAERHDVFHVLLGYSTDVIDETAMQFFLLGNGKFSLFSFGTAIISTILFPLHFKNFIQAYKKGKDATDISQWNFRLLLNENAESLRNKIFKKQSL